MGTILLGQCRTHRYARTVLLAVVGSHDLRLVTFQTILLQHRHHAAYQHTVIDATHGQTVGVILLVGQLQFFQTQRLRLVVDEIQLFHNYDVFKKFHAAKLGTIKTASYDLTYRNTTK